MAEITYKFAIDAEYYRVVIDRYYRQQPFVLWLPAQFGLLGAMFACLLVYLPSGFDVSRMPTALLAGALTLVGGIYLTRRGILWRFKRRADFGSEAVLTVSAAGINASGSHVHGHWDWQAYPNSVCYPDGILLLRAGAIRWLPDAAIQTGSKEELIALVNSKTRSRNIGF